MSHEDIVFNGNTFVENLNLILRKEPVDLDASIASFASKTLIDGVGTGSNGFLSTIATDTNPFVNWDGFVAHWKNLNPAGDETALLNSFLTDFKAQIGYVNGNPPTSDWHILSETIQGTGTDLDGFPRGVADALIEEYFKRSFSHFLATYRYVNPSDETQLASPGSVGVVGSATTAGANFFKEWARFMSRTAEFDDSTSGPGTAPNNVDFAAYEQIYSVFFPAEAGETAAEVQARYEARVRDFWKEQALGNGSLSVGGAWFIPSHSFDEWMEQLREEFIQGSVNKSTQLTTVGTPATKRVLVIDRVLRLLILMIDIMQRISASQAQRLTFLTNWQQAYTDLITQVPQFAQGDGTPLGGAAGQDDTGAMKAFRNKDANPHMQAVLEKVRARRSSVQDEAKQTQTTINSSQDAANQQTQMATSLLQQLSTILSQIFR